VNKEMAACEEDEDNEDEDARTDDDEDAIKNTNMRKKGLYTIKRVFKN
jgi:hypothetical protein